MIADGKIKLKNDSQIKSFTETGLLFEDGSQLPADVVVYATGYVFQQFLVSHILYPDNSRYGNSKEHIRSVCGNEVANRCSPIWDLNKEGELNGTWRDLGVPGLWYMMGMQFPQISAFTDEFTPLHCRQLGIVPFPLKTRRPA